MHKFRYRYLESKNIGKDKVRQVFSALNSETCQMNRKKLELQIKGRQIVELSSEPKFRIRNSGLIPFATTTLTYSEKCQISPNLLSLAYIENSHLQLLQFQGHGF
jgi:hypothetical protein